ncbi:MAG: prepilin-type N-terminal cleavage/methylation domain-containing protein [Planctomycetota bacterium]
MTTTPRTTPTVALQAGSLQVGESAQVGKSHQSGFTLMELVIAVAVFSTTILTMLYLRVEALERVKDSWETRYLQRLAQEKLDEVMFGVDDALDGEFEEDPRVLWTVDAHEIAGTSREEGEAPLVECTITLTYAPSERTEPREYTLTSWFFPQPESLLLEQIGLDEMDSIGGEQ